jgi:dihydroorotate dehydrogenase (NAD+) catalytic subunit
VVGSEAGEMAALMRRVRPLTAKPLIVKLTPNVSEIAPVARAAQEGGADALSLINTLRAAAVDPVSGRPWLGAGSGGLSGPAVRAVALALTAEVAAATDVPLVGMGGIQDGRQALDFVAAGASCVAVGTESFRDPMAGARVRDELASELQRRSLRRVHDARATFGGARTAP